MLCVHIANEIIYLVPLPVRTPDNVWNISPLHTAAMGGNPSIIQLLIINGANPNAHSSRGETPVSFAIKNNHQEIVELLRQHIKKMGNSLLGP